MEMWSIKVGEELSVFALLTSAAFDMSRGDNLAMYWGQKSKNTLPLAELCKNPNVNIVPIGFINNYFPNNSSMQFNLADNCDGEHLACQALESDIESCQQQGKIMLISLGGGDQSQPFNFASKDTAQAFAKLLYNSFLGGNDPSVPRPFGKAILDGIDIDLENGVSDHYDEMVVAVQAAAKSNGDSRKYWITGAPQCAMPEPHLEHALNTIAFDAIWIQFYNNDCGFNENLDTRQYNINDWYTRMQNANNLKNTKLFLGALANSNEGSHFVDIPVLQQYIEGAREKYSPAFGGVMLWDAYGAKANNDFDQQVKTVLTEKADSAFAAAAAADTEAATDVSKTTSSSADPFASNKTGSQAVETARDSTASSAASVSTEMPDVHRRYRSLHGHPHEGLVGF